MPVSETETIPQDGHVHRLPVRPLYRVSVTADEVLDIEKPLGVPHSFFRTVLDAYSRRVGIEATGGRWTEADDANVLRHAACLTIPKREPAENPALWLLRIRWNIRKATLSCDPVQRPAIGFAGGVPNEGWFAPSGVSVAALEAWALRCWQREPSIDRLYRQLFEERPRADKFHDYQTAHWLLWFGSCRGVGREETYDLAVRAGLFNAGWNQMASR